MYVILIDFILNAQQYFYFDNFLKPKTNKYMYVFDTESNCYELVYQM